MKISLLIALLSTPMTVFAQLHFKYECTSAARKYKPDNITWLHERTIVLGSDEGVIKINHELEGKSYPVGIELGIIGLELNEAADYILYDASNGGRRLFSRVESVKGQLPAVFALNLIPTDEPDVLLRTVCTRR